MAKNDAPPRWDRDMQRRLARGEAAALGECFDRFASLVHGLAHRVLGDEDAAFTVDSAEGHELAWYATQELQYIPNDRG